MRYSFSKICKFRQCPLSYRLEYIDKIRVERLETVEAFMGSAVHEALDIFHTKIGKDIIQTPEELLEIYCLIWDNGINPSVIVNDSALSQDHYRNLGIKCITDYYETYRPFNQAKTISTEMRVEIDLLDDGRYNFLGFIDRLDRTDQGTYEIHDYKTGQTLSGARNREKSEQLALYETGIRQKMNDVENVEHVWHYLRHNKEVRCSRTQKELEEMKQGIMKTVHLIEKTTEEDHFPAVRTKLCGWCEYQRVCPEKSKGSVSRQAKLSGFAEDKESYCVEFI